MWCCEGRHTNGCASSGATGEIRRSFRNNGSIRGSVGRHRHRGAWCGDCGRRWRIHGGRSCVPRRTRCCGFCGCWCLLGFAPTRALVLPALASTHRYDRRSLRSRGRAPYAPLPHTALGCGVSTGYQRGNTRLHHQPPRTPVPQRTQPPYAVTCLPRQCEDATQDTVTAAAVVPAARKPYGLCVCSWALSAAPNDEYTYMCVISRPREHAAARGSWACCCSRCFVLPPLTSAFAPHILFDPTNVTVV